MASYSFTANGTSQLSGNLATDKVRIATSSTSIHYATGFPNVAGNGTMTAATNTPNVTGVNTLFTTQLGRGYWIGNATGVTVGIVASIANTTSLTLTANANVAVSGAVYTYSPYGVPYVTANANCAIIPANSTERSVVVGQGNVVAFMQTASGTQGVFSVTELGAAHANTGTTGF